jgi:hypothetical protein
MDDDGAGAAERGRPVARAAGRPSDPAEVVDIIAGGPQATPRQWPTMPVAVAVLAVVVAAAAGYLIGSRHSSPANPGRSRSVTSPSAVDAYAPAGTGKLCWAQLGNRLQLGVEVVNQSSAPLRLDRVEAGLPIGGLRLAAAAWGSCGQLSPNSTASAYSLAPGAQAWVTMTFDVLEPCPAPYPVRFVVTYAVAAATARTAGVGGFADLGDVPYSGCTATAAPAPS